MNVYVDQARNTLREIRTIERNIRLGRYNGRNSASTDDLLRSKRTKADSLLLDLPRSISGAITAEHNLVTRISTARDAGQDRPELRRRLAATRREIRGAVA